MKRFIIPMLMLLAAVSGRAQEMAEFRTWAMTPPMGWNSWDCYYSSVNEKITMQNAQAMVDQDLVRHGWEDIDTPPSALFVDTIAVVTLTTLLLQVQPWSS